MRFALLLQGIEVLLLEQSAERQGPKSVPHDTLKVQLALAGMTSKEVDEADRQDALIVRALCKCLCATRLSICVAYECACRTW